MYRLTGLTLKGLTWKEKIFGTLVKCECNDDAMNTGDLVSKKFRSTVTKGLILKGRSLNLYTVANLPYGPCC